MTTKLKMKSNRVNWILLLLIVYADQSSQYSCEGINECLCMYMAPDGYVIDCPSDSASMITVVITSKRSGSATCRKMAEWSDLKINSTIEAENVTTFSFKQCSLPPDASLQDITRRIGVQPTDRLSFESYKNLSSTLKRRHLSGFPSIKELSLSANGLTELPADLLADLPELTLLELRENNVNLPPTFFKAVPKLQRLELGLNKLMHIDPMLFRDSGNLRFLALWGNELTDLETDVFQSLAGLSTLEISNNKLTTLHPEVMMPLSNLSTLHMSGNYFVSLPENLLSKNLKLTTFHLDFNHGNLSTLPNKFLNNLPVLRDVFLTSDKLEVLPGDIFWGSTSLENIKLKGNLLTTLPINIFNGSENLKSLDLSSNKLNNLPDGIFKALSKLEKLDLQKNAIASISGELFSGLTGLKELNLEFNGLKSIAPRGFTRLQSLQIARLSHNQLTLEEDPAASDHILSVEFGRQSPFHNCKNLKELHLAYNNITAIIDDWIFVLGNLRVLDLKYNRIASVATADFQFLSKNIDIYITHNNISQIDLDEAEVIATSQDISNNLNFKNVRIFMEENPIVCDCRLHNFLRYLEGEMHPNVQKIFHIIPGSLKCAGPGWMNHILVSDLKSKAVQCAFPDCPENCECWFRKYDYTVTANCSRRGLTTAPERISYEDGKIILDLTDNLLTEMPYVNQSGYGNITKLLLSNNRISSISPDDIPATLEVLELHNNNLVRIDSEVLERFKKSASLQNITLYGNPWKCDCDSRDFLNFVQSEFEKIRNFPNITCGGNLRPMTGMTATDLCPVATGSIVGISLGVTVLGLLIGILAALYYKYQTEIRVWLYGHPEWARFVPCLLPTEEEFDKDKLYDAFISFSHKDEDFVVNKLVPQLEEGPKPFKLCLHFRDWMAGEWIPTQIAKSVEDSRRTIVILSPNFLESVWGRMEFRAAHSQALSEGRARVIVVLFGDVGPTDNLDPELKAYLSMNTYVKWGDPWFWEKLRYALPHPPKEKKKNAKKIYENHQHHIKIAGDKNGLIHPPGYPTTPPAVTTPPADTLKTFTSDGSLNKGVLITDCLHDAAVNFNNSDTENDRATYKNKEDTNNIINRQCIPA